MSGVDPAATPENEANDDTGGISSFDFENLSPSALLVTRLILRGSEITYDQLCAALVALPAAEQITLVELAATLQGLLAADHIVVSPDDPPRYKVNLRRKNARHVRRGIWDALDTLPTAADPRAADRARRRDKVQNVWDTLGQDTPRRAPPTFTTQAPTPPEPAPPSDE